jgi:hypothetical protein
MRRFVASLALAASALAVVASQAGGGVAGTESLVTVGSPAGVFSQNKQNEPAVAINPLDPSIVVAGSNDNIDMEACDAGDSTTCPFTPDVGGSGVYFSFDSGRTWTQPTYAGWSARACLGPAECVPVLGPIGTLPGYYEAGLVSDGDPAVAFGPVPGPDGFDWSNGARLYYANLAASFSGTGTFKGAEAIAVSRTDDVEAAADGDESAWLAPVIVTKQSSTTFSDKEQIWADNAATSPFFGNVYVCVSSFRSNSQGLAIPQPLVMATSRDGGDTWTTKQVTPATNNAFNPIHGFGRSGCTIRTDSNGVVYVVANQFAVGLPGAGSHILIKSLDGGKSWTKPKQILTAVDTCVAVDPVNGRCVMDGIAGARDDLSSAPSVDIANGAPSGAGATNVIYNTWVDGGDGLNDENVMLSYSTDGGSTWSAPQNVTQGSDRGYYSAVALSPDGTDAYLVYNAFTTPFRSDTTSSRSLLAVVLQASVGSSGAPGTWFQIHRSEAGDPRASSQNNLVAEFLGDYVYADATNSYGVAVWNDVRNGGVCPAINAWRADLQAGGVGGVARPAPQADCPATFGNTDIYGFTTG